MKHLSYEVWWGLPPTGELLHIASDIESIIEATNQYLAFNSEKRFHVNMVAIRGKNRGQLGIIDFCGKIKWNTPK